MSREGFIPGACANLYCNPSPSYTQISSPEPLHILTMPSKPKATKDVSKAPAGDAKKGKSGGKNKKDDAAEGSSNAKALKPATAINARHILVSSLPYVFRPGCKGELDLVKMLER